MDDEFDTTGIDERIRRAVDVDVASARRIAAAALNAPPRRPPMGASRRTILVAAAVAIVVAAGVAGWRGRSVSPSPFAVRSLSIRGTGATVVVDGDDGRRWIVTSSDQARPQGGYVIVFPQ
jgi:hypothetical protein